MEREIRQGFTLIELIIVLAILAIIASVAVARFVDLREKTLQVQEETTIQSLRSALKLEYAKNCLNNNCHWYGSQAGEDDLFSLLENPPLHSLETNPPCEGGDGIHWYFKKQSPVAGQPIQWIIWCPHATWWSTCGGSGDATRNNIWFYCYQSPAAGATCPKGAIRHEYDVLGYFEGHQNLYAIRH